MPDEEVVGHTSILYADYDSVLFLCCSCRTFEVELKAEPTISEVLDLWRGHLKERGNV